MLSDDVFSCAGARIKDITPMLTMVGGEVAFTRLDASRIGGAIGL